MEDDVTRIVIVGGGAAGWLTAGIIASKHQVVSGGKPTVFVTLIESPEVPTIGVGEGTWPSMRGTLEKIGISEFQFLRQCSASFKQASKFVGWKSGGVDDFYFHPFTEPEAYGIADIYAGWRRSAPTSKFDQTVTFQTALCSANLAPRVLSSAEYRAQANYGYHFDSNKLGPLLTEHCKSSLGVHHISDYVKSVKLNDLGEIEEVVTRDNGRFQADLFIDCSGTKSLLLGEALGVPFIDRKELLNDAAVAIQVPYADEQAEIESSTIATAQTNGWVWDIGLFSRRGTGHVYSSSHCSADEAECALRAYIANSGCSSKDLEARHLQIRAGHREEIWYKNCVAVGMAAGFIEPLEASALAMIELSAGIISEEIPAVGNAMRHSANRFNKRILYRWDRIVDFLKLHYVLSDRRDSQYWHDATSVETTPESLLELLEIWKFRPPNYNDFVQNQEVFPSASYHYVLYGMGFNTRLTSDPLNSEKPEIAAKALQQVKALQQKYVKILPSNRQYLAAVHDYSN